MMHNTHPLWGVWTMGRHMDRWSVCLFFVLFAGAFLFCIHPAKGSVGTSMVTKGALSVQYYPGLRSVYTLFRVCPISVT
jgi:hypothetical protein